MGPASKAALVKRQLADSEVHAAILEELSWIRGKLNAMTGEGALDKESIDERLDKVENRIAAVERERA